MDLSFLTDQQLEAISKGDLSGIDDKTLERIAGGQQSKPLPTTPFDGTNAMQPMQQAAPSNLLKLAGIASVNAPGAVGTVINSLPGIGNPSQILPSMQNLARNPGQVPATLKRLADVQGGSELTPEEKIPALSGQVAGTALEMMAPMIKPKSVPMKGLTKQLESASGSMPGSLEAAYKDPSLIFAKGKEVAGPAYEAAKKEIPEGTSIFKGMYKPEEILDKAKDYVKSNRSMGTQMAPSDALVVRKAIDKLLKSGRYVKDELLALRNQFDDLAKFSSNIAKADPTYLRGSMAESLRNILPQNKYGGASAFKMGIAPALAGLGGFVGGPGGAAIGGGIAAAALSPIVQGAAATGAGLATRAIPKLAPIVQALISRRKKK